MRPDEFWAMTLREAAMICEASLYRIVEAAYWGEVMARQKTLKKSVDDYMTTPKSQSPEELEKHIHAIFQPLVKK